MSTYNKQVLNQQIENISLTSSQKDNVNNHFKTVEKRLRNLGVSNIQKQGSFGRGTVIRGQESGGFDLDIAVVVDSNDVFIASQLNELIKAELSLQYSSWTQEVSIEKKAVKTKVKSNFQIDVTQIYKKNNTELVFNSHNMSFDLSYALAFRKMFKEKNAKSIDNALRNLARIYKHIRDAVHDIEVKSLALEIILYNSFRTDINDYGNSLIKTLQNFEFIWKKRIENNKFSEIENPACISDPIPTGIQTKQEAEKLLILNTVVVKAIEGALVHEKSFHGLARKYYSLQELDNFFNSTTVIQPGKTVLGSGVFGGDDLN